MVTYRNVQIAREMFYLAIYTNIFVHLCKPDDLTGADYSTLIIVLPNFLW